jgi:hypothetical protein
MKKIQQFSFALLYLLMSSNLLAQTDPFRQQMDFIFQYVNRTPVTTGLLMDYSVEFANLPTFNGVLIRISLLGEASMLPSGRQSLMPMLLSWLLCLITVIRW